MHIILQNSLFEFVEDKGKMTCTWEISWFDFDINTQFFQVNVQDMVGMWIHHL